VASGPRLRVVTGWSGLVSVAKGAEVETEASSRVDWVRNENSGPMVTEIPVVGRLSAAAEEEVSVGRLVTGVEDKVEILRTGNERVVIDRERKVLTVRRPRLG
jgi:hypothetical protein